MSNDKVNKQNVVNLADGKYLYVFNVHTVSCKLILTTRRKRCKINVNVNATVEVLYKDFDSTNLQTQILLTDNYSMHVSTIIMLFKLL